MFASVPFDSEIRTKVCRKGLANFGIGTLADQSSLNWAIVPFTGGSRGSDPVAAMLDFSIGARPKPQRRPKVCLRDRPTGGLKPAIVNFGRVRGPLWRGRDNSSLVCGGITPYNLP